MPSSKTRRSIEIPDYLYADLAQLASADRITVTALATRLLYAAVREALTHQNQNPGARTTQPDGAAATR